MKARTPTIRRGGRGSSGAGAAVVVAALLAAALIGGAAIALASPAAAVAADYPPTFEYILAGDGEAGLWNAEDAATALVVDCDGSVYACGHLWHETTGYDMTVTRLDDAPDGWSATWNDPLDDDDVAADIAVAADGSVYVYGTAGSGPDEKPVLLKYSSAGVLLWAVYEDVNPWGHAQQIELDAAGNVYACSVEDNEDSGGTIGVLTRYGPEGAQAWSKRFGVSTYKPETFPSDLYVNGLGRSYVVGRAVSSDADIGQRAFVVSFTAAGSKRWTRVYDGAGRVGAEFAAVVKCPDGGVYVAGAARSDARDLLLARYAATGTRTWTRRMGAYDGHDQWATDAAVDSRGRLAFCGGWRRSDRGFYVAALRLDRTLRWAHNYLGDRHYGWARELAFDAADRVCVTGNTRGLLVDTVFCPGPVATYAFTTAGERRWRSLWPASTVVWTSPSGPRPSDIAVWQSSNAWVCGITEDRVGTGPDEFVIGWGL